MFSRVSVVVKLWLAFVGLTLLVLLVSGLALNRLMANFFSRQVTDPLIYHAQQLANMVSHSGGMGLAMAPLMGEMAGAGVYIADAAGRPVAFPGAAAAPPGADVIAGALAGGTVWAEEDSPDGSRLVAAVPIDAGGERIGAVVLMAPAARLEAALTGARRVLGLTVAGAVLLAFGLAMVLSRTLVRPLVRMEGAARAMARGRFDTRVDVGPRGDEIGRLGTAINALAGDLQRFERTRREFFANVAHELRTPLSYLRGYSQALAEGVVEEEADRSRYLKVIQEEAIRLGCLVDDLLELAVMDEGGALSLKRAPLDVSEPIHQAVAMLQPRAEATGVTVDVDVPPGLPAVHADGARIQQVLLNLLDNALRHTPAGGTVRVVAAPAPPGQVRMAVSDTGPGVPPDHLASIWDRFHRVPSESAAGGRGLGLAIVRSIVRAHGGEVGAESSAAGSTFWFTLPPARP